MPDGKNVGACLEKKGPKMPDPRLHFPLERLSDKAKNLLGFLWDCKYHNFYGLNNYFEGGIAGLIKELNEKGIETKTRTIKYKDRPGEEATEIRAIPFKYKP